MSIKHLELFHGAVLSKITRNENNKISLIEWNEDENRSLYSIETELSNNLSLMIKYHTTPRTSNKNGALSWRFADLSYRKNCYFCLVCIEAKIIDGDTVMEVCAISPDEVDKLFTKEEIDQGDLISCSVSLKKRESFRVRRKAKGIELTISRNAVDSI